MVFSTGRGEETLTIKNWKSLKTLIKLDEETPTGSEEPAENIENVYPKPADATLQNISSDETLPVWRQMMNVAKTRQMKIEPLPPTLVTAATRTVANLMEENTAGNTAGVLRETVWLAVLAETLAAATEPWEIPATLPPPEKGVPLSPYHVFNLLGEQNWKTLAEYTASYITEDFELLHNPNPEPAEEQQPNGQETR